jgi:hypothetical protein
MKPREKTKKEVRADVINATEKLNNLHKISEAFINDYIECDGDVWYSQAMKLRYAVWDVNYAKARVAQAKVSDNCGKNTTYIGNYED